MLEKYPFCPVCDNPMIEYKDESGGVLYELEHTCRVCQMYYYQSYYGNYEENIGLLRKSWTWDYNTVPKPHRNAEIEEARRIYRSSGGFTMFQAVKFDSTRMKELVFADWCAENDCELHEKYLRCELTEREKVENAI